MKVIKRVVEYLIAISVIPAIVLSVVHVTELKDVRNVQYELLSEEDGVFNITQGTYEKLVANKRIKNYELESNYPLITQEDMESATWYINDDLKNEIFIDENGVKRISVEVGQIILNGSESWNLGRSSSGWKTDGDTIPFYIMNINWSHANTDFNGLALNSLTNEYFESSRILITNDIEGFSFTPNGFIALRLNKNRLATPDVNGLRQYLQNNPITVTYELAVKNPNTMIIESSDITVTSDYVRLTRPNDFSGNSDGLYISGLLTYTGSYVDKFEVTSNWIHVYPKDITATKLANRMLGKILYYELPQPRPVEVYDFSKFRLVFNKNRIRVVFDIDDGYYLWEITKDDKMIPINGQYDLGNIWTVKFYVYEIQQPLIRNLVLLIPLIVVSGLLLYMMKKKDLSF